VRLPWQRRGYARTCGRCGYTWRVPRSAARRRVRSISAFQVGPKLDRGELAREIRSVEAENQAIDSYRHCPECGADQFTDRAEPRA
jgi:ribosomal protein S27AE